MKRLNNPFVTYGYKGAEYFCDRKVETNSILEALNNERNITLIAPRRIGKTGLIHHVFAQIKEQDPSVYCFYIDIFATKNLTQFIQLLAHNIIGKLDSPSKTALRRVSEFFGSFRPTMKFDARSGLPTFSIDISDNQQEQSLERIFEYLKESGKRCYIALDEFQQLMEYPEHNAEALLRSFIQFLPNVYFIFAGSRQHMMTEMFLSAKRPFFQSSQIVTLGEIDKDAYHEFASTLFARNKTSLDAEVFQYMYQRLDGQTWYIQTTMNRLYANHLKTIKAKDVDSSIQELVNEQAAAFENYFSTLTSNQCAVLLAIAREGNVKSPLSSAFIKNHHLPALSSVRTALNALIEQQFVYQYQGQYIVYDRFFGIWLSQIYG